jgi:tRNA(Ile)-lysidine synthase
LTAAGSAGRALPDRVPPHLDRTRLVDPEAAVLVACSGGLDSLVLLHLFRFPLRHRFGDLSAAHLDHAMRPGSAEDASWLGGVCRAWRVPLVVKRADPAPRSEAEARRTRYAFLERAAPPGTVIATAHHADDQAETVLLRLARGTGLRGLRGIAPRRGRVIRPLLPFPRSDLEQYAARARLTPRLDPTNVELRYARNRIRHRVLAELEAIRPGVAGRLAALAGEARRTEAAWDHALEALEREVVVAVDGDGVTLARDRLQVYHPHLQARLLRRLLRRFGTTPGRAGTQAALEFIISGPSGGSLHLPGGVRLERDFDRFRLAPAARLTATADRVVAVPGPEPGAARAMIGGRAFQVWWGDVPAGGDVERVTIPAPRFPLELRGWRPGDRIRFGYGAKKLKKLLGERRLDRRARARVPVLADGHGNVLWVVGIARATGVEAGGYGFEIAVRGGVDG